MIHELLATGRENAISGKVLATLINGNIRDVTAQIEKERRQGQPICATTQNKTPGYFLAANEEELQQYCEAIHRRASELYKTRRALLSVLQQIQEHAEQNGS